MGVNSLADSHFLKIKIKTGRKTTFTFQCHQNLWRPAVDYGNVYSLGEADVELTMRNTTPKEDKRKQV